jgi:hypothetical protein
MEIQRKIIAPTDECEWPTQGVEFEAGSVLLRQDGQRRGPPVAGLYRTIEKQVEKGDFDISKVVRILNEWEGRLADQQHLNERDSKSDARVTGANPASID